ncbi:MAG: wapA1 [Anaerocolumna sp.]|jgi:hypothetical protein|nr:wapA1 [Anaerocolumna sp.]
MGYDSNDLTNLATEGYKNQYTYDTAHNIKTVTTEGGLKYTYGYRNANNDGSPISMEIQGGTMKILSEFSYTPSGNFLSSESDQDGNITSYTYDENKGILWYLPNNSEEIIRSMSEDVHYSCIILKKDESIFNYSYALYNYESADSFDLFIFDRCNHFEEGVLPKLKQYDENIVNFIQFSSCK